MKYAKKCCKLSLSLEQLKVYHLVANCYQWAEGDMSDRRTIFIGKKPLHAYIRAVVMAMEAGDRSLNIVARGATIGRAVDVAEICRRRNGVIAQGLPSEIIIGNIDCSSEEIENDEGKKRIVSVLSIQIDGRGELPVSDSAEE